MLYSNICQAVVFPVGHGPLNLNIFPRAAGNDQRPGGT